jgi:hypothetical protein
MKWQGWGTSDNDLIIGSIPTIQEVLRDNLNQHGGDPADIRTEDLPDKSPEADTPDF